MITACRWTNEEESLTKQITMLIALRCTLTQSVLLGFRCGDTSGLNKKLPESKLGMSLEHSGQTCLVHKQTGTAHYAQQSTLTDPLHHAYSTNKEKTTKEDSRTASVSEQGRDNLDRYHSWRNLITLLDLCVSSPHCLPINRHITQ